MSCKRLDAVPLLPPRLRSVSRACERSTGTSWPGCHVRCLLSIKFVGEDSSFKSDVLKKNRKYGDKTLTWVRVFHLILFNLLHLKVCVQHFKYSAFFRHSDFFFLAWICSSIPLQSHFLSASQQCRGHFSLSSQEKVGVIHRTHTANPLGELCSSGPYK